MIKEAYCSYEISKLLKEKGFDEPTLAFYIPFEDGEVKFRIGSVETYFNTLENYPWMVSAPTHQMACAWLREEKNILIYVYPVIDLPVKNNYTFSWRWDGKKKRHNAPHIGDKHNYESFEEAVEAALKYVLENLL